VKPIDWPVVRWGACALALLYTLYYFANPATPGSQLQHPLGWWSWWDQSQYIASSRNLLARNFAPDGHWYPLGYPIAAAPFVRVFSAHGFFFLDLACLLATYAGFLSFARRVGVGAWVAVPIFVLTTFGYRVIGQTWAEPWTSTLNAALIWGALACATSLMPGQGPWQNWRLALLGLCAAAVPLVRPTDAVQSGIALLFVLIAGLRGRDMRLRHIGWLIFGGALVMVPYAALYLCIYGFHPMPYMLAEGNIGFAFSRLGWKTYLLLIEPRPWFPTGEGLLAVFPWLPLSIAEIVLLFVTWKQPAERAGLCMLALMILTYWTLYFAYVDLLPSNIWRYHVVHYLKWSLPGLGLLAWLFLSSVWRAPKWRHGIALAAVVVVLSVRLVPTLASADARVDMIQYAVSSPPGGEETYMHDWAFADRLGPLGALGIRVLLDSQGVRLLPTRRGIVGPLTSPDQLAFLTGPPKRWAARMTFSYPCWLPPYPCRSLQPGS
jgi:hypothetical protein